MRYSTDGGNHSLLNGGIGKGEEGPPLGAQKEGNQGSLAKIKN